MVETFQKKKNYALFDKFWYLKRAERFQELDYTGLYVDDFGNVNYSLHNHHMMQRGMVPRGLSTTARTRLNAVLQTSPT